MRASPFELRAGGQAVSGCAARPFRPRRPAGPSCRRRCRWCGCWRSEPWPPWHQWPCRPASEYLDRKIQRNTENRCRICMIYDPDKHHTQRKYLFLHLALLYILLAINQHFHLKAAVVCSHVCTRWERSRCDISKHLQTHRSESSSVNSHCSTTSTGLRSTQQISVHLSSGSLLVIPCAPDALFGINQSQ